MQNLFTIPIAHAKVEDLIFKINKVLINPAIIFIFALALVYFLYGVLEFLMNRDKADAQTAGKQHMLWGVIGMFIMVAVFTIMKIITNTVGADYIEIP